MSLQTQVNIEMAKAVPGDKATANPFVYPAESPKAGEDVRCGRFVWLDASGRAAGGAAGAVSTQPLGLVERVIDKFNYDLKSPGALTINNNSPLTVGMRGDYWVECAGAAAAGQKVFANTDDGAIAAGAAGASMSGHVETAWTVVQGGPAGAVIKISNWSA